MIIDDMEKSLEREVTKQGFLQNMGIRLPAKLSFLANGDDDKGQNLILFATATLLGPVLTFYLLKSHLPVSTKLNLSPLVYVSILYIFFTVFDSLIGRTLSFFSKSRSKPSFVVEFVKFFLTFFATSQYQYTFIFEPIFHYPRNTSISFIVTTIGSYSAVAAAIFYRFRQMKNITLKSKVAEAEAQYSLLESQMQPHFLFNSLNVLSELIYVDPDMANAMSQKMADLYREILNNSKTKFSTLESEISILLKYIEIQKIRFGDRISFQVDVSPAYYNLQIPSLMLQTLVENAIKHGISPKKDGGVINLSVKKEGPLFKVCISNTGALYKGHKESKRSTGLTNTKNRLELTYGSKHSFEIFSDDIKTYVQFFITGRTS